MMAAQHFDLGRGRPMLGYSASSGPMSLAAADEPVLYDQLGRNPPIQPMAEF